MKKILITLLVIAVIIVLLSFLMFYLTGKDVFYYSAMAASAISLAIELVKFLLYKEITVKGVTAVGKTANLIAIFYLFLLFVVLYALLFHPPLEFWRPKY